MDIFFGIVLTILVLLLVLCSLLFLRVWIGIAYKDAPMVELKVLCFSFRIFPRKEKKKKKKKKKNPSKKSSAKKREEPEKSETKQKKQPSEIFAFYRELVEEVIISALGRLGKHLVLKVDRLIIRIGSKDPAKTAVLYGGAIAGAETLIQLLSTLCNLRFGKDKNILVRACYDLDSTEFDIKISVGMKPWQALHIVLPALIGYLRTKEKFSAQSADVKIQNRI